MKYPEGFQLRRSYIMRKLTDLFCFTIFFCQIQYVSKFYSPLSWKYLRLYSNVIFQWSKGIVSCPIKYGGKLFMADVGKIILDKSIGGLFYMEV